MNGDQPGVQPDQRDPGPVHLSRRRAQPVNPLDRRASATKWLAVIVDDSAAPITPYIYWMVFDIGSQTSGTLIGHVPTGARVADNSKGTARYDPPCPLNSSHMYRFTVYALNRTLSLPNGASMKTAWMAIAQATIARPPADRNGRP